jgi:hypothetical protein
MKSGRSAALAVLLVCILGAGVSAQQNSFELPDSARPQLNKRQPNISPTVPAPPTAPNSVQEIPQVYLGCWQARIEQPDSWQRLHGPRISGWVPKTETFCFRRNGDAVEVTLHSLEIDEAVNQGRIFNIESEVYVTASNGEKIALHTLGSYQQYEKILGLFRGPLATLKREGTLNCTLLTDQQTMLVEAAETQYCSGGWGCTDGPSLTATWHGAFHRVADPGSNSGTP